MDLLGDVRGVLGAVADRALDLALPAAVRRLPPRGRGALLGLPAGARRPARRRRRACPIGLPADIPAPLLQLEWCAPFTGVARRALHALKYDGERRLAPPLGAAVARRWERAGVGGRRARARAGVAGSGARARLRPGGAASPPRPARRLRLPMLPALERTRATTAQFDLDRAARASNLGGAFRVVARAPTLTGGRWLVLVDDVVTTGATLAACAATLLDAGALRRIGGRRGPGALRPSARPLAARR